MSLFDSVFESLNCNCESIIYLNFVLLCYASLGIWLLKGAKNLKKAGGILDRIAYVGGCFFHKWEETPCRS